MKVGCILVTIYVQQLEPETNMVTDSSVRCSWPEKISLGMKLQPLEHDEAIILPLCYLVIYRLITTDSLKVD